MIMDGQLVFANEWAETATAAHPSTDTIDCEIATPNFGVGTPLWVNVVVSTALTSDGAATMVFALEDAADNGSGAPDTFAVLIQTEAYLKAATVAGFPLLVVPLPAYHRRHLKISWTIGVAVLTGGTVNAWIGLDPAPDNS